MGNDRDCVPMDRIVDIEEPLPSPAPLAVVQHHKRQGQDHIALAQVAEGVDKRAQVRIPDRPQVSRQQECPRQAQQAEAREYRALPPLRPGEVQDHPQDDQAPAVVTVPDGGQEAHQQV